MAAELLDDLCMDLRRTFNITSWSEKEKRVGSIQEQRSFQSGQLSGLGLTDGPALGHVRRLPLPLSSLPNWGVNLSLWLNV